MKATGGGSLWTAKPRQANTPPPRAIHQQPTPQLLPHHRRMPRIKFQIPHPNEDGCVITGIIEQPNGAILETDSHVKPVALVGFSRLIYRNDISS